MNRWHLPGIALPLLIVGLSFTAFGADLLVQPSRWDNTPSYANLLDLMGQAWWGLLHLVAAAIMAASIVFRHHRILAVVAHTMGVALVGSWLAAFVVRWLTDPGTTIVNVVTWSVYLYLMLYSVWQLDRYMTSGGRPPRNGDR
ncbi:MAG: hypothetical protein NVSMB4_02630 [Acidimicrobiales bacterium]